MPVPVICAPLRTPIGRFGGGLADVRSDDLAALVLKSVVERTGVDLNVSGEVTINHTDSAVSDLRVLIGLRVPREELEKLFGFSGLERYEKMLAGQPKVIEHRAEGQRDA